MVFQPNILGEHPLHHPRVAEAWRVLRGIDEETLLRQVELTEIPAPSGAEGRRGERMAELLAETGVAGVHLDRVGNVLGTFPGATEAPPLLLSAHLDTIFPEETDLRVRREGDQLTGPGISDDGRGLAALLAIAHCLTATRMPLATPLLFVASVGEEGKGNLRGMRHLFRDGSPLRDARGFISLDGAGMSRIVTRALGVRRLRITVRGPGGHSWIDRRAPNPIHALGVAVAQMARLDPGRDPAAALAVTRWGGGTSINAIPQEAWAEVDLRCESGTLLSEMEEGLRRIAGEALGAMRASAGAEREEMTLAIETIGERPAGSTDPDSDLVRAAVWATRQVGGIPRFATSSTDSNVPMSLGIPGHHDGRGGRGRSRSHSPGMV